MRARISLLDGTEVRPSRAREAFWRWEQTWERLTRDIVAMVRVRWSPDGRSEGLKSGGISFDG